MPPHRPDRDPAFYRLHKLSRVDDPALRADCTPLPFAQCDSAALDVKRASRLLLVVQGGHLGPGHGDARWHGGDVDVQLEELLDAGQVAEGVGELSEQVQRADAGLLPAGGDIVVEAEFAGDRDVAALKRRWCPPGRASGPKTASTAVASTAAQELAFDEEGDDDGSGPDESQEQPEHVLESIHGS